MDPVAHRILQELSSVAKEREKRRRRPGLVDRVESLKHYQQERFRRTYADLLAHPRYEQAARFFLEELYGPGDFSTRDAQFARIVPTLVKLFPGSIVTTVATLAELHALSEQLDTTMGEHLPSDTVTAADYVAAWQATGERDARLKQVELLLEVGRALDGYARKPMLRTTLRMMRGPATAAGLGELQHFLETGFDTFKGMKGAREFLETVAGREKALIEALFQPEADTGRPGKSRQGDSPLVQLP